MKIKIELKCTCTLMSCNGLLTLTEIGQIAEL